MRCVRNVLGRSGIAGVIALCSGAAMAQNNLGDGRGLDSGLQAYGPRTNSARQDMSAALQFRNAIVTGNAPGGLSFRGDVGYVGARDFRGSLGSDETFEFRRDSLYSGLSGMGLRGTSSLQFQLGATTGNSVPSHILGNLNFERGSSVLTTRNVRTSTPTTPTSTSAVRNANEALNTDLEDTNAGLWRLRSTSGFLSDRTLLPSHVGSRQSRSGAMSDVYASPLLGITTNLNPASNPEPSRAEQAARDRQVKTAHDRIVESLRSSLRPAGLEGEETSDASAPNAAEDAAASDAFAQLKNRMRMYLAETGDTIETDRGRAQTDRTDFGFAKPETAEGTEPEEITEADRMAERIERIGGDASFLRQLRDQGQVASTFSDVDPEGTDYYAIHMKAGEGLLAARRYFDAEARFTLALSIRASDPTASVARVHASMGAGLIRTPAINLRSAFMGSPELLALRFDGALLPPGDRVEQLKLVYRETIARTGPSARAAALLLAYLGFQTSDNSAIADGLDRLEADGPDRLAQIAREVWLDDAPDGGEDQSK